MSEITKIENQSSKKQIKAENEVSTQEATELKKTGIEAFNIIKTYVMGQ